MKQIKIILTIIAIHFSSIVFAQISDQYWQSGDTLESLRDLNTIEYADYFTSKLDGYRKCEKVSRKLTHCYDVGVKTYFYNGEISKRVYETRDRSYYIDMYQRDGTQILKNGFGYIYTIETGTNDFPHRDSLVYQITDSIRTGSFRRFRRYLNTKYYLIETGSLIDNQENGTWNSKETKLGITQIKNFVKGKEEGYYFLRQNSINKIEFGTMLNNRRNGIWTITDTNNTKVEESNYSKGYYNGLFIQYYPNGKASIRGNYIQIKGVREYFVDTHEGIIEKQKKIVKNLPVKNGVWEYYDELGNLIRKETYKRGTLK